MKKIILLILLSFSTVVYAQSINTFPVNWLGKWSGKLEIMNKAQVVKSLTMELLIDTIQSADSVAQWKWEITYIDGETIDNRKYILKEINSTTGEYAIDENNGIALSSFYFKENLFSYFKVGNILLSSTYRLENETIIFEIQTIQIENPTSSGGVSDEIPEVLSYPINGFHKAVLQKVTD